MSDNRTPEEIAENRIAEWKLGPARRINWIVGRASGAGNSVEAGVLSLDGLGLKRVPESLRKLRDLVFLSLSENEIEELPGWISELASLKIIGLSGNRLKTLPPEIGSLRELFILRLRDNQLETLPQTLEGLHLEELCLQGNDKLRLPESLLGRPPLEILRYYFESRDDKGLPLLELKLLLVGRGQAGKTTLVKQLAYEQPNAYEPETPSISIRDLTIKCPRGEVRTRAWDFGGQEILHATHRFFLTERSLYLLVLEPRSGVAQRDAEYWLKLIEARACGSPVIVVMNWSGGGRRWRVDEVRLRRKFPFIVDFIPTDALHGDGITELRRTIERVVDEQMRDVWIPFPKRWREIKNAVSGMKENFLTYNQYVELCNSFGERDADAQSFVAGILNTLGLALYFGNDPRLHDTRVLNPRWVTGGVYAVIRSPFVANNDGQLAAKNMPQILAEADENGIIEAEDYPPQTHPFILDLMRAYELCYTSEEEDGQPLRYLVPELLPEFEPEMNEPWVTSPVRLRYRYEVLPPGLLPRFIVRTHALSDGSPHWRHGVVLRHVEAKALIRAESNPPELQLFFLNGDEETCHVLVAMVRRELETLHEDLKIQPVEELELSGADEHWISVKALRQVEKPDFQKQNLPIQPEGTAEVDVAKELNKLLPADVRAFDRNPASAPIPVRLFVSYAHDDERQLKRLDAMLDVLEQYHGLAPWRDKRLIAGQQWDSEIRRRLEDMDIFLFVASQASLVRPYIKDPELRRARERHESSGVEILTVKLEPCACDDDPFLGKLQRLAPKFESIAQAGLRSAAWEQVRKDLLPVIKRVREKRALPPKESTLVISPTSTT